MLNYEGNNPVYSFTVTPERWHISGYIDFTSDCKWLLDSNRVTRYMADNKVDFKIGWPENGVKSYLRCSSGMVVGCGDSSRSG